MSIAAAPVLLRHWGCIDCLDGLGRAVFTFKLATGGERDQLVMVYMLPRTVSCDRAVIFDDIGDSVPVTWASLPYVVRDIAESVTRDLFPMSVARR